MQLFLLPDTSPPHLSLIKLVQLYGSAFLHSLNRWNILIFIDGMEMINYT